MRLHDAVDINDLTRTSMADLVRGLWEALDAVNHANTLKEAYRDELRRRVGPDFATGNLEAGGRNLYGWWWPSCKVTDEKLLRTEAKKFGVSEKVYLVNNRSLIKIMKTNPRFAKAVHGAVETQNNLSFKQAEHSLTELEQS